MSKYFYSFMMTYLSRAVVLSCVVFLLVACASYQRRHQDITDEITLDEKYDIINEKLEFYNSQFPEMRFLLAEGGKNWQHDIVSVLAILGNGAVNLDYEHPPELAGDLLDVNMTRLVYMMQHNMVAATSFRVGENSTQDRSYLCIITMNPETYIKNSFDAFSYMLDLPKSLLSKVHPERYLDTTEHLKFTLDHEIFHCLDSYYEGGAPVTALTFGAEYNSFRRESAADAYALAMNLRREGKKSKYAKNIMLVRALWLYTESPDRSTYDSMLEIYDTSVWRLRKMTIRNLIDYVVSTAEDTVGDYEHYIRQRANAISAAKKLGHAPRLYGDEWKLIERIKTDPRQVDYKIERYRYYFSQLFSDGEVEFKPEDRALSKEKSAE